MSEELKIELGEELAQQEAQQEVKVEDVVAKIEEPLTGLKLYNAFKKDQPKGMSKEDLASAWIAYKTKLGLPIIEKKVKKEKKEKKPKKVSENRISKKNEIDDVSQMIGDFNIGVPLVEVSA